MKANLLLTAAAAGCLVLTACGESKYRQVGSEHRTMRECLSIVERRTGHDLDVISDKPHWVSGRLEGTDRDFGCQRQETGTKGVYYLAYYDVPK